MVSSAQRFSFWDDQILIGQTMGSCACCYFFAKNITKSWAPTPASVGIERILLGFWLLISSQLQPWSLDPSKNEALYAFTWAVSCMAAVGDLGNGRIYVTGDWPVASVGNFDDVWTKTFTSPWSAFGGRWSARESGGPVTESDDVWRAEHRSVHNVVSASSHPFNHHSHPNLPYFMGMECAVLKEMLKKVRINSLCRWFLYHKTHVKSSSKQLIRCGMLRFAAPTEPWEKKGGWFFRPFSVVAICRANHGLFQRVERTRVTKVAR